MKRFSDSDFLRLAASFAVVLNHAAGANTPKNVYSSGFAAVCAINAVSHFSVPVFIMISGRFMLGRDKNISGAIKHALKCVIWIAVWSVIYFADKLFFYGAAEAFSAREPQHLWYLYTACLLYTSIYIIRYNRRRGRRKARSAVIQYSERFNIIGGRSNGR